MEREKEIGRLVNVLRKTARMAMQAEWIASVPDAATYCVEQYNRVLARLKDLAPEIATVFEPLPPGSSLTVTAMACRQLSAYFEEEAGRERVWGGANAFKFDASTFKDFWRDSAKEIDDFGEFIRRSVDEWSRRQKAGCRPPEPPRPPEAG